MELGIALPQIGHYPSATDLAITARRAEEIGFDSLWVADRLLRPVDPRDPYPGTPDLSWPEQFENCLDPLTALTFAAAHTQHIALGTSTLNVPFYRPVDLARRLASLDLVSDGRLRIGAGLGWSLDEFEALGIPKAGLGRRLEDHLDTIEAIWRGGIVAHEGDGYRIAPSVIGPLPVQRPRPPVYLGAFTEAGMERIARRADGWLTVFLPIEVTRAMFARIRELTAGAGRDPDAIRMVVRANASVSAERITQAPVPFAGTIEQIADDVVRFAELGAHELFIDLQYSPGMPNAMAMLDVAEQIHNRVGHHIDRPRRQLAAVAQ